MNITLINHHAAVAQPRLQATRLRREGQRRAGVSLVWVSAARGAKTPCA